jgi:heme A synthase
MSFREKSAWIALVSVLVCFGAYFGALAMHLIGGRGLPALHLLLACAIAFAALRAALMFIAARTTPAEERKLRDERELIIQARSHTLGFYVLVALVLALGVPGHLGHPTPDLLNFALLDVVIAGVVVALAQIVMFRRG